MTPRLLRALLPLLLLPLLPSPLAAQALDIEGADRRKIEIPFRLENDFIVLDIVFNRRLPMRFLLDTGAENTVLLDKSVTDAMDMEYLRRYEVRGSDIDNPLVAHLVAGIQLDMGEALTAYNRTMLVLEENHFNFEGITGVGIDGILGGDFLRRWVVRLDFKNQKLILLDPVRFRPARKSVEVPSTFVRNRAYVNIPVGVRSPRPITRKLLIDSGAGLPLLIHTFEEDDVDDLPEQVVETSIASGLGGNLNGSVGRSRYLSIGGKELGEIVTYFQPTDTTLSFLNQREGLIGLRILKRFTVTIDYVHQKVYFQPEGRRWKARFAFDRSGMGLVAGGDNLSRYIVSNVVNGSPADRAGVRVGDRLRRINNIPAILIGLGGVLRRLESPSGTKVRLRFEREGRLFEVAVVLEDII